MASLEEQALAGENAIKGAELEPFDNPHQDERFVVSIICPELFTHCPKTGYPDLGQICIQYIPNQRCVELKSLKLYTNKFQYSKQFHEDLTGRVFKDLKALLDPLFLRVRIDFSPRGNVSTRVAFQGGSLQESEVPWRLVEDTPAVRL